MELEVYETYFTWADLRTEDGWHEWIGEIRVLYEQDGRRGYYYGAVTVSAPRYGGLGSTGYPVSVGLADDRIYAHELGHNMRLGHAPCGGPYHPDPDYPYGNGGIGIWGYDIHKDRLLDPADYRDVMGYCSLNWISDYHFSRATRHRLYGDGGVVLGGSGPGSDGRERGEMLVVWGSVEDGRVQLDPAFVLDGPPVLPETDGPTGSMGWVWTAGRSFRSRSPRLRWNSGEAASSSSFPGRTIGPARWTGSCCRARRESTS